MGGAVCLCLSLSAISQAEAAGFPFAPSPGELGYVQVNPYGNAPSSALIDLSSKRISDIRVKVIGNGRKGVDIEYPVGPQVLNRHHGPPSLAYTQPMPIR
ncbi:aryl-sulfate sulfotransferase N-terminal domain-containing protein [Ferrimonas pelagia]|uniref:Arylsulfotransferase N-terminal domain-containing protein n=1 Tax=Ferrimonas pelagia TaxID=1177826 RepID=A0ABP9EIX8_9GAMM